MRNIKKSSINFRICLVVFLLCYSHLAYSTTERSKYWDSVNLSGNLFNIQRALYFLDVEARIDAQNDQFEQTISVGGVGYQWLPNLSLWLGYQGNSFNQLSGGKPQNAVWEQILWKMINNDSIKLSSRTRLEQRTEVDQSQWVSRLRERVTLKLPKKINDHLTPVIYDEIFIDVNSPAWVNSHAMHENRAFMGVDILTSEKTYLEVGYLNQYRWSFTGNSDNHILLISLYIET